MDINQYLSSFFKGTKEPSLEAMKYFMEKLEHPEETVKFVHIAGTNGKGSVVEMLSTVLEKAGYRVGEFVSPHIIRYNERIRINHKEISDEELEELINQLQPIIQTYNQEHKVPVTLFELETTMAILYFAKKQCEIVILETGLGGLYDCTNIVNPLLSIITSVSYDHMNILGNTLEEIAVQKAGIIKENSETICISQTPEIDNVIAKTCKNKKNILHMIQKENLKNIEYCMDFQSFDYQDRKQIQINLKGEKQIENASIVIEAIDVLKRKGYIISEEHVRQGLKTVIHKARFEKIYDNPTIIFDGGHNEAAIQNLKKTVNQYYEKKKKIYIFSILKTKDYKTVIKELMEDTNSIFIFTDGITKNQDDVTKYVPKETLYKEAKKYRSENLYKDSLQNAITTCKENNQDYIILIIGSFYIYEEVMEDLKK